MVQPKSDVEAMPEDAVAFISKGPCNHGVFKYNFENILEVSGEKSCIVFDVVNQDGTKHRSQQH